MAAETPALTLRPFVEADEAEVTSWFADAGELLAETPTTVRLARLAMAPCHRGKGFGRAFVQGLIEKARTAGATLITLSVHQDNSSAIRAYGGFGFVPGGTVRAHSNVRLELPLD
jgi:ribosomal-protein-alanine N-acetyltransferase